ncbi:MAG: M23 family metallopeptidase [Spirochaetes bacterium]|nr:M23 family metallopeptidase [Spirochaetota bacterium]
MKHWQLHINSKASLSITILSAEVIIIFRGKKNTIIKSIPFKKIQNVLYACGIITAVVVLCVGMVGFNDVFKSEAAWYDEIKKKAITTKDYEENDKKPALKIIKHTVKPGESISEIARLYGVSMDTICGCNKLESYDLVHVGQVLKIPNKDGLLVSVQRGQTLPVLAKKYNVAINKIIEENTIANPDFINVGQDIFIPDAKPLDIFKGFLWPVKTKNVTSGYGWRKDPFYGETQFHQGIDVRAHYEWVRASKYGRISYAGWLGGYGKVVVITHPGGDRTLYGHLSKIIVREGQYVKQGQIIAKSGNTGNSTGPHLHFEIIRKGQHINPYTELKKKH